ncbi:MAG TPA: SprB repeat-containing protein, partial [Saprospiraceae bacterium]|nr:SprB repeat-containing protein [Saprospiraceae bacterium]
IARWGPPDNCSGCPALNASGAVTNPLCYGSSNGSINITPPTNGSPPYSYNWSNGAMTEDINGLVAGNYTLTVTDGSSCSTTFSFILTAPPAIVLNITVQSVSCHGDHDGSLTVNPTGGFPGYLYLWSNGANTNSINNLAPGNYTVTVTDSHNCTKTSSAVIIDPPVLSLITTGQNITCFGLFNGSATVNVSGGTPGYQYEWSTGGTGSSINNLSAGIYTVTVTDLNGCEDSAQVQITQPPALTLATSATGVTCFGNSNGSATATASGGTPGYGFLWSNGGNTATITNLSAGSYVVTVTDANGCTKANNVVIVSPLALVLSVSGQNVSCYGGSNGSAAVAVSGGTTGYTYLWSTGSAADSIINVPAGNYQVTVTDNAGCTSVGNITIESPEALEVSIIITDVSAPGEADGTASAEVDGGTPAYTYLWSTGETTSSIENLAAGNYSLTVTDDHGCSEEVFFTIAAPDCGLTLSVITDPITCYGSQNGSANAEYSGGNGNTEFLWSNGETSQMISNLGSGTYFVTITDGNCTAFSYATLTDPPVVTGQIIAQSTACNQATGSASVIANGGTGALSFVWSNGETTATIDSLQSGIYSITVSDQNECSLILAAVVGSIDSLAPVMVQA